MMTVQQFAKAIEHLLLTGAIEGEEVMKLYDLLKAYERGGIEATALQEAIDQHDPEHLQQWLDEQLPPLFE